MGALQTRLTRQLASRGVKDAKGMAVALLTKRGDMKDGKLTEKGKERQALGDAGRAKDRQARYSGRKPEDFKYDAKTNAATLKKR